MDNDNFAFSLYWNVYMYETMKGKHWSKCYILDVLFSY